MKYIAKAIQLRNKIKKVTATDSKIFINILKKYVYLQEYSPTLKRIKTNLKNQECYFLSDLHIPNPKPVTYLVK